MSHLETILEKFKEKRVMVIGDIMLDTYIWGEVERISPEAPVPVVDVKNETANLGGAANVANNIIALTGKCTLVGVIGRDIHGKRIEELLDEKGINRDGVFTQVGHPTTTKTRIIALHQQIVRVDRETRSPVDETVIDKVIKFVKRNMEKIDAILFEDYDKGMLSEQLIRSIIEIAGDKIITADPKFDNFFSYKGVTLFKPNRREVERAMGVKLSRENVITQGKKLRDIIGCKGLLLTLGGDGAMLFDSISEYKIEPKILLKVHDETAAGDAVISTVTMALTAGANLQDASLLSSYSAGIEVAKLGAVPVEYDELYEAISNG